MKTLKFVGLGFVFIIAFILFVALFVPKDLIYEKSISINAPIEKVWIHTNSLSALDKWSPWNDYDPNMEKGLTGVDGTVGAMQIWKSSVENVGNGSQKIVLIKEPTLFETELKFTSPRESIAKAFVKLIPEGNKTSVTWGFKSKMPYPFNIMILFMNMEKTMGKDWDNGLSKLKMLSEK